MQVKLIKTGGNLTSFEERGKNTTKGHVPAVMDGEDSEEDFGDGTTNIPTDETDLFKSLVEEAGMKNTPHRPTKKHPIGVSPEMSDEEKNCSVS